jgi:hypothetical protein
VALHNTVSFSFSSSFLSFTFYPSASLLGLYYLYLSLAGVVQGLRPAWDLRRTLSERPLEGPVKGEKGLSILFPHLAPYRSS